MTKNPTSKSIDKVSRRVTLRELRLLLAVSEAGSILKAAEEIGLTQPAASRAISDLENTMGARLFDRTNRGVEATLQGRILLEHSRGIFDQIRLAVAEIDALSDSTAGEVRVGATPAMCAGLLAHIVAQAIGSSTAVRHHVEEMDAARLADALRSRTLDLTLGREAPAHASGNLVFEHLFDDQLFIVAGRLHQMATRRKIRFEEFAEQQWLLPAPESETGRQVTDVFRHRGVNLPPTAVTTMSFPMRCRLLQSGNHLTVLHGSALRYAQLSGVCVLPLALGVSIPIGISRLQGRTLPPAAEAFAKRIRSTSRSLGTLNPRELNSGLR